MKRKPARRRSSLRSSQNGSVFVAINRHPLFTILTFLIIAAFATVIIAAIMLHKLQEEVLEHMSVQVLPQTQITPSSSLTPTVSAFPKQ